MDSTVGEIISRVQAGDQAALAELYDRYADTLLALAYRILRDRAEAEDVLLEVLERAWREADRFDPERGSVRVWLTVMVRSRALDLLRVRRRRERVAAEAARSGDEGVGFRGTAGDASELEDLRRHVVTALQELPPAQREAIELAYYGGLSQSEIAARLSLPLGTVKTRMRDGLQKLRVVLRPIHAGQAL
ncbi:MAG: sigma-70 family RNA polymerase sigma factor [Gemmatimonadetes bacterium]|nr:sigma-70 family RNA polymerase sigma factor [Gemmatimonadota bacterium]